MTLEGFPILIDALKDSSIEKLSLRVTSGPDTTGAKVHGASGLCEIQLQGVVKDANSQAHPVRFLASSLTALVDLDVTGCECDVFLDFRVHERSVYPARRSFRSRTYRRNSDALSAYAAGGMFPNVHSFDPPFISVEPDYQVDSKLQSCCCLLLGSAPSQTSPSLDCEI